MKKKRNADFYIIMTATISEGCGNYDDNNNNNNINSQRTIKNRLSPAQINTGK